MNHRRALFFSHSTPYRVVFTENTIIAVPLVLSPWQHPTVPYYSGLYWLLSVIFTDTQHFRNLLAVGFLLLLSSPVESFQPILSGGSRLLSRVLLKVATATEPSSTSTRNAEFQEAPAGSVITPPAPLTIWGDPIENILETQVKFSNLKPSQFPSTIKCSDLGIDSSDTAVQLEYVKHHAMEIKQQMVESGAVVFRGFDLMKTQEGFQAFYKALGMKVCLDPLHAVSARPTVDGKKDSPVYEAVNKESRKNFFIGMHNEFVGTRAPRAAAFVCFKPADVGGEFLIADGRAIFRDLKPSVLERLYSRNIRYSVMELPFFGFIDNIPDFTRGFVQSIIKSVVSSAINAKVDFNVELLWGEGGYDQVRMLQARAPSQPPIVRHPVTGEPTWFCNVHSHSSVLRKARESIYGAERFEDGASQINKSDMFYGDDGEINEEDLRHMDEVTMKNVQFIKMTHGDVVLLDNYKCMHGRNVFDGTRKHGVAWFEGWEGEEEMKNNAKIPDVY